MPTSDEVIGWLLDADPSIRWQVMRDLTDTPAEIVAAERARVASEGWGPRLLDRQRPDGQWGDGVTTPFWWSNLYTLLFLRDLGLDPASARGADRDRPRAQPRHVGTRVRRLALLRGRGRAVHQRPRRRARRLFRRAQRSTRRSAAGRAARGRRLELRGGAGVGALVVPHDDLRARRTAGVRAGVRRTRRRSRTRGERGQEYLLERRLLRRLSTGEIIDAGVDARSRFRRSGTTTCCARSTICARPACGRMRASRRPSRSCASGGRATGAGCSTCGIATPCTRNWPATVGAPNRWITLRALRVLDWSSLRD